MLKSRCSIIGVRILPGPRASHTEQLKTIRIMEDFLQGKRQLIDAHPNLARRLSVIRPDDAETIKVWNVAEKVCRNDSVRKTVLGQDGNRMTLRELYKCFESRLPKGLTQSRLNVALILAACLHYRRCINEVYVQATHPLELYSTRRNPSPLRPPAIDSR